jgi:hypothetical protein
MRNPDEGVLQGKEVKTNWKLEKLENWKCGIYGAFFGAFSIRR